MLNYLNIIREHIKQHDQFKFSTEEEIKEIIDDIKTYIERKIYKKYSYY